MFSEGHEVKCCLCRSSLHDIAVVIKRSPYCLECTRNLTAEALKDEEMVDNAWIATKRTLERQEALRKAYEREKRRFM